MKVTEQSASRGLAESDKSGFGQLSLEANTMTSKQAGAPSLATVEVTGRRNPPNWAVKQRYLIDLMNRAAPAFVERYCRPDGTLIWRDEWPGMDGSDDGYESFLSFPLFYILGGGEHVHELGRREWDAVTWQFTEYGQVYREYDAYYDWMHHGESYTYLSYLAMANPDHHIDRTRALRFAGMYNGEDPEAPNWDPVHKMIRSPISGSRGPIFEMTAEDWVTHRPVLAHYLAPYEDIPGVNSDDPLVVVDWNDDEMFAKVLKLMNERMVPGDVPLNLNATSHIASAYLYTGEGKYKQWVLDYLQAWFERTERNGGVMPDNVGPNGVIGERMNGKWWGGYYGWRWPHGAWIMLESSLIAGSNATLLTGDTSWLDLHRSQADMLWEKREEREGQIVVPARHGDVGWFDYRPVNPLSYVHLYYMSQEEQDLARIAERFPGWEEWRSPKWRGRPRFGKAGMYPPMGWFAYMQGHNPDFPEQALEDTYSAICGRLERIEADGDVDDWNLDEWDVHHWQDLNPVIPEALIQMAMGTPSEVYHGGLLHAHVRYFDPQRKRPGLPEHVAALVETITPEGITLTLVNTDPLEGRDVIVQAGAFGEHQFTEVRLDGNAADVVPDGAGDGAQRVGSRHLVVRLGPSAQARLHLGVKRFANQPTYAFPPFE
jgi:hypothetical protein